MITSDMVSKIYDRINFQDHGPEGIAEGLAEVFRDNLAELLEGADDLEDVVIAAAREQAIREGMAVTGEDRKTITEFLDAHVSMDREAVLDLTDGEPTTLADALHRYVEELEKRDELQPRDRIAGELETILAYPWPGHGLELVSDYPEGDDHLVITLGGEEVASANHDDHGWSGMRAVQSTAEAVHKAIMDRVNKR